MAEDNYSRTEPASERRLAQARAGGDVPRSHDFSALFSLAVMVSGLLGWGAYLFAEIQHLMAAYFRNLSHIPSSQFTPEPAFFLIQQIGVLVLPYLFVLFLAGLLAPMLISGWVFAPQAMRFRSERLNPFTRLLRVFSANGLFDGLKALYIWVAVAGALAWFFFAHLDALTVLVVVPPVDAVVMAGNLLIKGLLLMLVVVFFVALLDVPWQWWRYWQRMAMTRAEVLAEAREAESHPEFKARLFARQRANRKGEAA